MTEETVKIRESSRKDHSLIRSVHLNAFGPSEGEAIAQLAIDLLGDKTALPLLSLVAEENGMLLGNAIFSSVSIEGDKENNAAYILAPLAVLEDYQSKGIGTALINEGLNILKKREAKLVFVLGDPNYYMRTGFMRCHKIVAPYALAYPEAWMVQELEPGVVARIEGVLKCALSLDSPEHW